MKEVVEIALERMDAVLVGKSRGGWYTFPILRNRRWIRSSGRTTGRDSLARGPVAIVAGGGG